MKKDKPPSEQEMKMVFEGSMLIRSELDALMQKIFKLGRDSTEGRLAAIAVIVEVCVGFKISFVDLMLRAVRAHLIAWYGARKHEDLLDVPED